MGPGTRLAPIRDVTFLFVLVLVVGIGVVGFFAWYGGALLSRPRSKPPITRVEPRPRADYLVMPTMPSLPPVPPGRFARGTTPQPLATDTAPFVIGDPTPPVVGVVSNRDDATEPDARPGDRFSVIKSKR